MNKTNVTHSRCERRTNRVGASAIEFAITAPIILMLVFGGLELSRANLLRNTCEFAALEGAREGIVPGATATKCQDRAQEHLDLLGVKDSEVIISPTVILDDTDEITVTVRIPMTENALPMSQFVLGETMERSITLKRETTEN